MMSESILALMIPICGVLAPFIMIVFLRRYENAERMAMIDRGMNPYQQKKSRDVNPAGALRWGLLALGAGLGLLVGSFLARYTAIDEEAAYFSMLLIFGGLGLLLSYLVQLRMDEKQHAQDKAEKSYEKISLDKD